MFIFFIRKAYLNIDFIIFVNKKITFFFAFFISTIAKNLHMDIKKTFRFVSFYRLRVLFIFSSAKLKVY